MTKKNTTLYVSIAAAVGIGAFLAFRNSHRNEVATTIAVQRGEPEPPKLNWAELILGSATEHFQKAKALDEKIRQRGPRHYALWKLAVKRKWPVYAVLDPSHVPACFWTSTGEKAPMDKCPKAVINLAWLEGWS